MVSGNAVEAALEAAEQLQQQRNQQRKTIELEVEHAQYEARLAAKRYEAVDPENRLVAASWKRGGMQLSSRRGNSNKNSRSSMPALAVLPFPTEVFCSA